MIAKRLSKVFLFSVVDVKSGTWVGGSETLRSAAKQGGGNNINTEYSTEEWLSEVIITELADSCWYTLNAIQQGEADYSNDSFRCFTPVPIRKNYSNQSFTSEVPEEARGKLFLLGTSLSGYKRCRIWCSRSASFSWQAHSSFKGTGEEGERWLRDVDIDSMSQGAFTGLLSCFVKCLPRQRHAVDTSMWKPKISKCGEGLNNPKACYPQSPPQHHGGPCKDTTFVKGAISAPFSSSADLSSWQTP